MKKIARVLLAAGAVSILSGCAVSTKAPLMGPWYTDTHSGVSATSNQAGNRVGEACATSILGVSSGDASIESARRNGGITMISSVDEHYKSVLFGVWAEYCTIVRGR